MINIMQILSQIEVVSNLHIVHIPLIGILFSVRVELLQTGGAVAELK